MNWVERYEAVIHAVQTAIAAILYSNAPAAKRQAERFRDPKHLRVGLDARAADQEGLARLLIAKGVFTEDEYLEAVACSMEREAESIRRRASELCGLPYNTEFR
jgi:hypothetical protein